MIAKVITDISLDKEFDYLVPPELEADIRVGAAVDVPFGKTLRSGYVVALSDQQTYTRSPLKEISAVSARRAAIPENLMKLGSWMADYYCSTREQAIRTLLPAAVRSGKVKALVSRIFYLPDIAAAERYLVEHADEKRLEKRLETVKLMLRLREGTSTEISGHPEYSVSAFDALRKSGLITFREENLRRDVFGDIAVLPSKPLPPTPGQKKALGTISEVLDGKHQQHVILLHGVTNSG